MIIKTGFYNWHEFGKKDTFYPDDLPYEWRLNFYANEFECVHIALSDFSQDDDFEEIFEDLPESFDMLVYCDDPEQWPLLQALLAIERVALKVVVCDEVSYPVFLEHLQPISIACLCVADKKILNVPNTPEMMQLMHQTMHIIYVDSAMDLKQWRIFIDEWVAQQADDVYYLLLDSTKFNAKAATELRILVDMMGY